MAPNTLTGRKRFLADLNDAIATYRDGPQKNSAGAYIRGLSSLLSTVKANQKPISYTKTFVKVITTTLLCAP